MSIQATDRLRPQRGQLLPFLYDTTPSPPRLLTLNAAVLLEPGLLGREYRTGWDSSMNPGLEMTMEERTRTVGRAYERNGFLYLNKEEDDEVMGRRVDPRDHPAAPGDVAITPPDPPETDLQTPTPQRLKRNEIRSRSPESPGLDVSSSDSSDSSDSSSPASPRRLLFP